MSSHALARKPKDVAPTGLRDARDAMYRRHILDTAERVFAESGEVGTKMQDVAAAASISLATLYAAFPSKAELYQAIVAARGDELLARVADSIADLRREGATPIAVMLRGMGTHLRYFMEHPAFLRLNLLEGHAWYDRAARPSREQEDHWSRGQAFVEAGFALGQRGGFFVREETSAQARTMVALQQARLASWVLGGMREPPDEVIARIQAEFVRTFCRPAAACRILDDDGVRLRPDALAMRFAPEAVPARPATEATRPRRARRTKERA